MKDGTAPRKLQRNDLALPTVLLVDAQNDRRAQIAHWLAQSGIAYREESCALSAVESVLAFRPDLIAAAESLPKLDTPQLLHLLRDFNETMFIPVVVYGRSARKRTACERAGATAYLNSPLDPVKTVQRLKSLLKREAGSFFHGDLGVVTLADVIQMLMAAHCTGELRIDHESQTAKLGLQDGHIFHASFRSLSGEEAVLEILRITRGQGEFSFYPELPAGGLEKNVNRRTDHLLLSLASIIDEEHQPGAAEPPNAQQKS